MKAFISNKIIVPLLELLKQGITPEKLALSIAIGFMIGIVPLPGVSTAICAILAIVLDINIVAIQVSNYAAYPLQLILYIPFIRAGETMLGSTASGLTISGIKILFNEGFTTALKVLWYANLQGIIVWLIITVPVTLLLYLIFLLIFRRFKDEVPAGD